MYEREYDYRDSTELVIGFYSSRAEAEQVVSQLGTKPGFKEHLDGFTIDEIRLGRSAGWEKNFYTEVGPPPKDAKAEHFDLPFWMSKSEGQKAE